MAKTFYTERDIEDLANQGVKSLELGEDVVLTDLARDKARRLGVELLERRAARPSSGQAAAPNRSPSAPGASKPRARDLETRIFDSVKARLGDQVDDALLRTIVKRVIKSLGGDKR